MGKAAARASSNVRKLMEAKAESAKESFQEWRDGFDNARVGLALTAIKNRIEQDMAVAIGAYEIDNIIVEEDYRVHARPEDGLRDILALKARHDACVELIEKYQEEINKQIEWQNIQIKEQIAESEAIAAGLEEETGTDQDENASEGAVGEAE